MPILAHKLKQSDINKSHYLITGNEIYFKNRSKHLIKKHLQAQDEYDFLSFDITSSSFDFSQIKQHTANLSLFSQRNCISIDVSGKLNKKANEEMLALLKDSDDTTFVITMDKLSKAQEKTNWIAWLMQQGLVILANELKKEEALYWAKLMLKKRHIETTPEGYQFIVENNQNNLSSLMQDIEKISLVFKEGTISLEEIQSCMSDQSKFNIFQCIDEALLKNPQKALYMLKQLEINHAEPTLILWALLKEVRTLTNMRHAFDKGAKLNDLFYHHKVWQSKKRAYKTQVETNSLLKFYDILHQAKVIDETIKGLRQGNVWYALQSLLFKVAS